MTKKRSVKLRKRNHRSESWNRERPRAPRFAKNHVVKSVVTHNYSRYIYKLLKYMHDDLEISRSAKEVLNSFLQDIFERLAREASQLGHISGKPTMQSREIQAAVELVLPGELCTCAKSEGTKAVIKFMAR